MTVDKETISINTELGRYWLMMRIFIDMHQDNVDMFRLADIWLVAINQNGGFTRVWVTLKTLFFPIIIVEMIWFWRRLRLISRPPSLLEKMLLSLGAALTFLNLPIEYATLAFEMPWVNLFNDVKQGIFYANLLVFWLIFAGEHLIGSYKSDAPRQKDNGNPTQVKRMAKEAR